MKTKEVLTKTKRRGLTLIELVIVLAIIVVLGGLVAPVITKLLSRAFSAGEASIIPEINKVISTRLASSGQVGDRYDALNYGAEPFQYLPNNAAAPLGGATLGTAMGGMLAAVETLNAGAGGNDPAGWKLTCLNRHGFENIIARRSVTNQEVEDGLNVTTMSDNIDATTGRTVPTAITGATNMVKLAPATVMRIFGEGADLEASKSVKNLVIPGPAGGGGGAGPGAVAYLLFGLGAGCSLVGTDLGLESAPIHQTDGIAGDPRKFYQRYGVVFAAYQVWDMRDPQNRAATAKAGRKLPKLDFIGACAFNADEITAAGAAMESFTEQQ